MTYCPLATTTNHPLRSWRTNKDIDRFAFGQIDRLSNDPSKISKEFRI